MIKTKQVMVFEPDNHVGFSSQELANIEQCVPESHSEIVYTDTESGTESCSLFLMLLQLLPNTLTECHIEARAKRNPDEQDFSRQAFTSFVELVEWAYRSPYNFCICSGELSAEQDALLKEVINYKIH